MKPITLEKVKQTLPVEIVNDLAGFELTAENFNLNTNEAEKKLQGKPEHSFIIHKGSDNNSVEVSYVVGKNITHVKLSLAINKISLQKKIFRVSRSGELLNQELEHMVNLLKYDTVVGKRSTWYYGVIKNILAKYNIQLDPTFDKIFRKMINQIEVDHQIKLTLGSILRVLHQFEKRVANIEAELKIETPRLIQKIRDYNKSVTLSQSKINVTLDNSESLAKQCLLQEILISSIITGSKLDEDTRIFNSDYLGSLKNIFPNNWSGKELARLEQKHLRQLLPQGSIEPGLDKKSNQETSPPTLPDLPLNPDKKIARLTEIFSYIEPKKLHQLEKEIQANQYKIKDQSLMQKAIFIVDQNRIAASIHHLSGTKKRSNSLFSKTHHEQTTTKKRSVTHIPLRKK